MHTNTKVTIYPSQALTGGEDSLFICPNGSAAGDHDSWNWKFHGDTHVLSRLSKTAKFIPKSMESIGIYWNLLESIGIGIDGI